MRLEVSKIFIGLLIDIVYTGRMKKFFYTFGICLYPILIYTAIQSSLGMFLAKAKELLAEAGHPNGEGLPTLTYSTNDSAYHKKIAEYLQQAWKELGVNVEVNIVEWKSFTPQRRSGNYQIARDGWVMDYNDPSNILQLTQTGNGNNSSKYSNPEYDALLEKAAKEVDPQTRFGYFHQAEEMLMRDMGVTPLLYYNEMYLQSDKVKDSYHTADGIYHFEYADIAE